MKSIEFCSFVAAEVERKLCVARVVDRGRLWSSQH